MIQRTRRALAPPATAAPRPGSAAPPPPGLPPRRTSARRARGSGRAGAPAEALVRRSDVEPCLTCGICGGLLRDATAFSECLDAFCRKCIYDKLEKENIKCCPTCGIHLGRAPLEKLRPDHSLQHIRSVIFPAKRRKVATSKKSKEKVSAESIHSSVVDIIAEGSSAPLTPAASQIAAQKVEVEVIVDADEALVAQEPVYEPSILNLAPVGRDVLSRIRCRDFYSACYLSAETGALIVWQPPPIPEDMVVHDQLAHRQGDPQAFGPPATSRGGSSVGAGAPLYPRALHGSPPKPPLNISAMGEGEEEEMRRKKKRTRRGGKRRKGKISPLSLQILDPPLATSDAEYQQQAPAVQMTDTSVVAGSSSHARMTDQDDDNLRRDIRTYFDESIEKVMGRYDAHIGQLKAENSKLIELLEKERAAALERTKILEERHQQELKNERAAADGRTRTLEESFQRQLDNEREGVLVSMRMLKERLEKESDIARSATDRNRSLEEDNARLYEELENGRADNQALMADLVEKSDELVTLKYHCDMFESDKNDLENQVEDLMKELEYAKKEHTRYVRQVLDAARAIPNNLE